MDEFSVTYLLRISQMNISKTGKRRNHPPLRDVSNSMQFNPDWPSASLGVDAVGHIHTHYYCI